MKRKDIKALHGKSVDDLKKELATIRTELLKLTVEGTIRKEKNTNKAQTLRDDSARIQTVLKELELQKGAKK